MSMVWEMFARRGDGSGGYLAECKWCKRELRIPPSKTTTNLLAHLKNNHASEVRRWREEKDVKSGLSSKAQTKIDASFNRVMGPETRRAINKKLAILLADASLSLRLPRLQCFKNFVQSLNASYIPPTTRTLLKIMKDYVGDIDRQNQKLVSRVSKDDANIVITADCWTSFNANTGLLAVSGHVSSPKFDRRENFILDCIPLGQESHTADLIADKIRGSLARLNLKDTDVFALIADGASIMKKAAITMDINYIQYTAHVINLAIRSALKSEQVAPVIRKVKDLTSKLNRSAVLKGMLSRYMKEENIPPISIASDCPTRWNSTYMMVCDFLAAHPALERLIEQQGLDHFEQHEVKVLSALQKYLEPFYGLTKKVCSADATISFSLAGGKLLLATTEMNNNDPRIKLRQFGDDLLTKTKKYFAKWFDNKVIRIATLLDPRFAFEEKILYADQ